MYFYALFKNSSRQGLTICIDNYRGKAIEGNVKNRKTELSLNPPTFFNWYYPEYHLHIQKQSSSCQKYDFIALKKNKQTEFLKDLSTVKSKQVYFIRGFFL